MCRPFASLRAGSKGRRYAWGPWLVVVATGLLLPVELFEIVHRVRLGRVVIFIVNLLIVVYLVRYVRQRHRAPR